MVLILTFFPCWGLMFYGFLETKWPLSVLLGLAFAPGLGLGIVVWLARRAVAREFRAAHGRLCPQCGGDVRLLGDRGTCPGCMQPFDAKRAAEVWAMASLVWHEPSPSRRSSPA